VVTTAFGGSSNRYSPLNIRRKSNWFLLKVMSYMYHPSYMRALEMPWKWAISRQNQTFNVVSINVHVVLIGEMTELRVL
jgi:hypothetical protein